MQEWEVIYISYTFLHILSLYSRQSKVCLVVSLTPKEFGWQGEGVLCKAVTKGQLGEEIAGTGTGAAFPHSLIL